MNSKLYKFPYLLTIAILFPLLLGACNGAIEEATPIPGSLGEVIEGTYIVSYGIDGSGDPPYSPNVIGYLSLNNGGYNFTPAEGVAIPDFSVERFFFISHPKGNYSIEFQPPYDQNTVLENLEKDAMVTKIIFIEGNSWNDIFYIRTDIGDDELYFHSSYSELQLWGVHKSWDD